MTKEKWIDILKTFVFAVLAGVSISIGCIANLASSSAVIGAIFFCVGLFTILIFDFNLFTGKLCYTFDNKPKYLLKLLLILAGNFVGANITGLLLNLTRLVSLKEKCIVLVDAKLGDNLLSLFILGVLCNILIYIAVEGFKSENNVIKFLSLIFGVSVFVLCGFEHCVADMFYFAFAMNYSGQMFLSLFIIILGNFVGGSIFHLLRKVFIKKKN